jgi:hypothetical protein
MKTGSAKRPKLPRQAGRLGRTPAGASRGGFKIGREAFAAISAVEGLRLSAEMEKEFRAFDRKGLTARERRQAIMAKYCK